MTVVVHNDPRVETAFNMRREALSRNVGEHEEQWRTIETAGLQPNESDYLQANLEIAKYPGWHPLYGGSMLRVTMYGEGEFTGQKKSAFMRRIVKAGTGLKQNEIEWLMIREGGTGRNFRHTWWVFSHDELHSAARV